MKKKQKKTIDIQKIITKKDPILAKKLKKWLVLFPLVRWLIREKSINRICAVAGDIRGIEFAEKVLKHKKITVHMIGQIPTEGEFIFAANHPLGGVDGLALIIIIGKIWKNIKFLANDFLMHITQLSDIFVGVNKQGGQNKEFAKEMNDIFLGNQVIYFPAGLCSRMIDGQIKDLEWKKNFIVQAIRHKRNIVPMYIHARNSDFFYWCAKMREKLKIKSNPEMVLLPREMVAQKNFEILIIVGESIPYATFDNSKTNLEWAQWVKNECYKLKEKIKN